MNLYFVRHGQSEANILGEFSNRGIKHPLTPLGIRQAETLAANLSQKGITAIYSSPLLRATQTAEILSKRLGLPYQVSDALREFDTGILEGRSDPEGWALYDQVMIDWLQLNRWESRLPGGESFEDIRGRFEPFVRSLLETQPPDANIVLVGHGGTYRCMLPVVLENIDFDFTCTHHIGNTEYVLAEFQQGRLVCISWCGAECLSGGLNVD